MKTVKSLEFIGLYKMKSTKINTNYNDINSLFITKE